ncbi:MAG: hypothetical protein O3A39_04830, partial [Proteobacteria bacterium]|nr:hypothetical protein [Pseudomonadota bacterium]
LSENQLDALIEQGKKMIRETELKYTVNTLVHLSRELWGNNSTEFLAGALRSVITDKQMVVLIDDLERQVKEISK